MEALVTEENSKHKRISIAVKDLQMDDKEEIKPFEFYLKYNTLCWNETVAEQQMRWAISEESI